MSNSQARVEEVFAEAARLFESKNRAYGDSWRQNGWRGNISRIFEKAGRLRNMLWRGGNVLLNGGNEHPRETMLDMLNTLAFAIINMDDDVEWGHEPGAKEIYPSNLQGPSVPREQPATELPFGYRGPVVPEADLSGFTLPQHVPGAQTIVAPHVGEVPTPGEEDPFADERGDRKPSPKPRRVAVTDKGSGPRKRSAHPDPLDKINEQG